MSELKGQNVNFTIKSSVDKDTETKSKSKQTLVGDIISFNVSATKKEPSSSVFTLTGSSLNINSTQIGSWSWIEKKARICMICKLSIKDGQKVSRCPMCQSLFHDDHIFEWLKVKGKCPVCIQSLLPGGTEPVNL
ncbi:MAG TPA: RING finger domain-containing protein [Candidatus Bathyarchaeia archaeon]|nr:RING finger domain-containing protein [Candidatus Bathyarchaeia archaeon]